jgi:inner membrane protein
LENATHTLTGLFLSRAGLNRLTPAATPLLMLSANAPDVDILATMGGAAAYLHWHRYVTHSIVFLPVMALAATAVVRLFYRKERFAWLPAFLVAMVGVASHLLLDLTNVYGVRLLAPFSNRWFRWDITNVIDLWIWAALLACLAAPLLSKLVSSEVGGSRAAKYPGRAHAILALAFLVIYNGARFVAHERITATLNTRRYEGTAPLRVAAFPISQNPAYWRGIAETEDAYFIFPMNLFDLEAFNPALGETEYKAKPNAAIEAANRTYAFQVMREFAQFPVYRVIPSAELAGGYRIILYDLRFGFTSTALVDREMKVRSSVFQFRFAK